MSNVMPQTPRTDRLRSISLAREKPVTRKVVGIWITAAFVLAGFALSLYLGDPKAHPGVAAALGLGLVLWFFVDLPQPDAPFGMVFGGAMGLIEWQDGLRAWCGLFALACLWCARSTQQRRET